MKDSRRTFFILEIKDSETNLSIDLELEDFETNFLC